MKQPKKVRRVRGNVPEEKEILPNPTPNKKTRVSLKTVQDVKRLLSLTINELRREEIDPTRAGKIFYGLTVMLSVFEQIDLENQIKALEKKMGVETA